MLTNTHRNAPFPVHPQDSTPRPETSRGQSATSGRTPLGLSKGHIPPQPEYRLTLAVGGKYAKLKGPASQWTKRPESRRGKIRQFSRKARSRMIQAMCQVDTRSLPPGLLFVTLTYPRHYSEDPTDWHRDLEVWCKRLARKMPDVFGFWKLEFQKRGAPHFHLLLFGGPHDGPRFTAFRSWVTSSWFEVVRSGDPLHRKAGTNVQRVKSVRQLVRYASKYIGKSEDDERQAGIGRVWGVINPTAVPTAIHTITVSEGEFFALRRVFKRFMGASRGYFRPGGTRSGVWVALDSGTAKRLLDLFSAKADGPIEIVAGALLLESKWGCP